MSVQTSFTEKISRSQKGYNRFLSLFRGNGNFRFSFLYIKNGVCGFFLLIDSLIFFINGDGAAAFDICKKYFRVKRKAIACRFCDRHDVFNALIR